MIASLYGVPDKTHELAKCSKKIKLLTEERNVLGTQLNSYRRAIDGDIKEKIDDIFKVLQQDNDEKLCQSKQLYAGYLSLKKQVDKYSEAAQKLSTANMDTILFTDKLPATLNRKCKIDGILPISELKILVYKGDSYALLEQLPTSKYFCCLGDQASTSHDLTFKSAKSPEQHSNVLTGISKLLNNSTVYDHILSYHSIASSGLHKTTISCFSN